MQVAKGAWEALEAVASDGGGGGGRVASTGGGRHRKAADAARDLLNLACVDAKPVDLVACYHRCCRLALGVGAAVGAAEVRRGKGSGRKNERLGFLKAGISAAERDEYG